LRRERFHASILDMELDGKSEQVLLRDFQMHPYRQLVLHVDFQRVAADQPVHMRVPLHFSGQEHSAAVKESGAIVGHVLSELDITCLPKDLPEFIAVDLSALKATDTIKVLDLKLPAGVKPVVKGKENPVVVSVTIPGAVVEEEPTAAPVAAAEVPATAQKAPATPAEGAPAAPEKKGGKDEKEKGGDKKK
jgi:large subunit ribosomal protein L25